MRAERLLRRLYDAGFAVEADGDELVVTPARLVSPTLRRRIRVQKYELLEVLEEATADPPEPPCVDCVRTLPHSGVRSPDCRDALDAPACTFCGVEIDGTDLSICQLCSLEARDVRGAVTTGEDP